MNNFRIYKEYKEMCNNLKIYSIVQITDYIVLFDYNIKKLYWFIKIIFGSSYI